MRELIYLALFLPVAAGIVTLCVRKSWLVKAINLTASVCTSTLLFTLIVQVKEAGTFMYGWLYIDALSSILLLVVGILSLTATFFSISYMDRELSEGRITFKALKRYYALLQMFIFTMIVVLVVENLGFMWVGVEATTLASTLLVAFYFNRSALEAAWKYVMVCNVGILFALLGTILLYYTQVAAGSPEVDALSWTALKAMSGKLDPMLVKLAFIFILIGYGTKAGMAPMHTWLPDAHSQAPSPVSGLLSGALLSCALYVLLRNLVVLEGAMGTGFIHAALLLFGLFSVAIAIPFILIQHDMKRLLAYSSVEHMGIVTIGVGIGTHLALYGAVLHILNHAVAKSALFYLSGIISQQYDSKHLKRIRGMFTALPMVGTLFMVTVLAIVGMPPLNIFLSKFIIISAAFANGQPILGFGLLLLLAGVFAGMMFYATRMVFGAVPSNFHPKALGVSALVACFLSVMWIIITGLYLPPGLEQLLDQAATIAMGRG